MPWDLIAVSVVGALNAFFAIRGRHRILRPIHTLVFGLTTWSIGTIMAHRDARELYEAQTRTLDECLIGWQELQDGVEDFVLAHNGSCF